MRGYGKHNNPMEGSSYAKRGKATSTNERGNPVVTGKAKRGLDRISNPGRKKA